MISVCTSCAVFVVKRLASAALVVGTMQMDREMALGRFELKGMEVSVLLVVPILLVDDDDGVVDGAVVVDLIEVNVVTVASLLLNDVEVCNGMEMVAATKDNCYCLLFDDLYCY